MSLTRRLILAFALIAGLSPAFAQAPPPVPALPDTERRTSYTIAGTTCACAVNFALYGDSTDFQNWIEVFLNGVLQTGNYTITSPTGPLASIPRPITDAVLTFNAAQTGTVQIVGARRPRRTSQFSENRGVAARDLNQALTDIIAQNRETWDKTNDITGRAVLARPGETLNLLPILANRLNQGACFDSGGNLTTCVSVPASTFTNGNGITFTGSNPTTISANIGAGLAISGGQVVTAPGVVTNAIVGGAIITSAPTVNSTFCGQVAALGGNAQFAFTVGAASGFPANCVLTALNAGNWSTGRGIQLSVNGLTLSSNILYPTQTIKFRNINNAWVQDPAYQIVQAPLGQKLFLDPGGSDSNDCLATGTANACLTLNHVIMGVIWGQLLATSGSATGGTPGFDVRLALDSSCVVTTGVGCYAGLHYSGAPKQVEGFNSVMIECDGGSATNCTIADNSGNCAIGVFNGGINLEIKNVTLAGGSSNNCLVEATTGQVRIESGVVLGPTAGGTTAQLQADGAGGKIVVEGSNTVTIGAGNSGSLASCSFGGFIQLDQATFSFAGNVNYNQQTLSAAGVCMISATSVTWTLNAHTVAATHNISAINGGWVNTGGTAASVPGTNSQLGGGCATTNVATSCGFWN